MEPTKYDLIHTLSQSFDLHMVIPVLNFYESLQVYENKDLNNAKMDLLAKTNMVDYASTLTENAQVKASMAEKKKEVLATFATLEANAAPLLKITTKNVDMMEQLKKQEEFSLTELAKNHGVTPQVLENFFAFGKFQYECGAYALSAQVFKIYRELDVKGEKNFDAMWGLLASHIMVMLSESNQQNVQTAWADLQELQKLIDFRDSDPLHPPNTLEQLQLRAWMLHWSLFIFFHSNEGRNQIVEFFLLERKHKNVIETVCPWLLRYVTAAIIANKNRNKRWFGALLNAINTEKYEYTDPVLELWEILMTDFEFEKALEALARCEAVLKIDYFLAGMVNDFLESSKVIIFETQCRLSTSVDIAYLCAKLKIPAGDSEKWVVEMIRGSKSLDAKIDVENNRIVLQSPQVQVWQSALEGSKDLGLRTFALANGIQQMKSEGLMS